MRSALASIGRAHVSQNRGGGAGEGEPECQAVSSEHGESA